MDIQFVDPAEAPVPPEQMQFQSVVVEPFADGRRVGVTLTVTPFLVRPSIDLEILDPQGVTVASSSIIEATDTQMTVTLHLRRPAPEQNYVLSASLHYPEHGQVDHKQSEFRLADSAGS